MRSRAQSADVPDRPLRFIVSFPPGGPHDLPKRLIAPGIASSRIAPAAPTLPTIAESGLSGYEAAISYGVFPRAGGPKTLVESLHTAIDGTIRSLDIAKKFAALAADPQFGSHPEFAACVSSDFAKWARLAKEAGLEAE